MNSNILDTRTEKIKYGYPSIQRTGLSSNASHLLDRHLLHHHILIRPVLPVAREGHNLLRHILPFDPLAENRVLAGEPSRRRQRDEELRAVGVGPGIGHGEFARLVEFVRRALGLVFKLISRSARARALRIAALNHEVGNHTVKNGSVIEAVFGFLARRSMRPFALALGKFDEV